VLEEEDAERHAGLVGYLQHNLARIEYPIPGGRWLATSQAIFNVRMMMLAGRWTDFWNQPGLHALLMLTFSAPTGQRKEA